MNFIGIQLFWAVLGCSGAVLPYFILLTARPIQSRRSRWVGSTWGGHFSYFRFVFLFLMFYMFLKWWANFRNPGVFVGLVPLVFSPKESLGTLAKPKTTFEKNREFWPHVEKNNRDVSDSSNKTLQKLKKRRKPKNTKRLKPKRYKRRGIARTFNFEYAFGQWTKTKPTKHEDDTLKKPFETKTIQMDRHTFTPSHWNIHKLTIGSLQAMENIK